MRRVRGSIEKTQDGSGLFFAYSKLEAEIT